MTEESTTEAMMGLRGELAALQYKRDRLLAELNDMRNQVRCKEQRASEIENESEILREQAARQTAVIATLKHRNQDLEEKDRNLSAELSRTESALNSLQLEHRAQDERVKVLERRVRDLETECHEEEQTKLAIRSAMADHVRRLATALGEPDPPDPHMSQDCLLHKASDLVQLVSRLRSRSCTITETLESVETELRSCREALERAVADRDNFQRQAANNLIALDRMKQEKEELEIQKKLTDRELMELREKLSSLSKELVCSRSSSAAQDAYVMQLKGELQGKEEKVIRAQAELRHLMESFAIALSTPSRFVESTEDGVKARMREIIDENKDKCVQIDGLKEKVHVLSAQLNRQNEIDDQLGNKIRCLEEEKSLLESRLSKVEDDLHNVEVVRENLRRDKNTFMSFLENLGRALGIDEEKECDVHMQTESLLLRAEQLARMETDRIVDKLLCHQTNNCIPCTPAFKMKRERSFPDLCVKETSAVHQLQRKLRTLREQVQRKDLHLDLLRRKLSQQEENCRVRSAITSERDEAALKCKKMSKQIDRLQVQLAEARALSQDLKTQLAEAGDHKIAALERGRKVEELQQRLVDSELLRTRYNKKIQLLKDQIRATSQSADQERTIAEHSIQLLRDDVNAAKIALAESTRRETQLSNFRGVVAKTLAVPPTTTDYEIINKLEKVVAAHREFTMLSRRYEESVPGVSPGPPRTPRYEDSGFIEAADLDDNEDLYHKRGSRLATHNH